MEIDDKKVKEDLTVPDIVGMLERSADNLALGKTTAAEAAPAIRLIASSIEEAFRNERVRIESLHIDEIMAIKTETRDEFKTRISQLMDKADDFKFALEFALKMFNKWLDTHNLDQYETYAVKNMIEDMLGIEARMKEEAESGKTE